MVWELYIFFTRVNEVKSLQIYVKIVTYKFYKFEYVPSKSLQIYVKIVHFCVKTFQIIGVGIDEIHFEFSMTMMFLEFIGDAERPNYVHVLVL